MRSFEETRRRQGLPSWAAMGVLLQLIVLGHVWHLVAYDPSSKAASAIRYEEMGSPASVLWAANQGYHDAFDSDSARGEPIVRLVVGQGHVSLEESVYEVYGVLVYRRATAQVSEFSMQDPEMMLDGNRVNESSVRQVLFNRGFAAANVSGVHQPQAAGASVASVLVRDDRAKYLILLIALSVAITGVVWTRVLTGLRAQRVAASHQP